MSLTDSHKLLPDCRYTAEHIWVRREQEECVVGITDFAQRQLTTVLFVDLPAPGSHMEAGSVFGHVESLKTVSELFMPLSGRITAVNEAVERVPSLLNTDPCGDGWLMRILPDHADDYAGLLDMHAYQKGL